jgi:hypothetical protein
MSSAVSPIRDPLVEGNKTYHDITEDLCSPTERAPSLSWVLGFLVAVAFAAFGVFSIIWTIWFGIGTWDLNRTINWGWDITNFVWWVGIGHAGTLISAILAAFPPEVADRGKPRSRSDDHLRGCLCRSVPAYSHGAYLGRPSLFSLSQHSRSACG